MECVTLKRNFNLVCMNISTLKRFFFLKGLIIGLKLEQSMQSSNIYYTVTTVKLNSWVQFSH